MRQKNILFIFFWLCASFLSYLSFAQFNTTQAATYSIEGYVFDTIFSDKKSGVTVNAVGIPGTICTTACNPQLTDNSGHYKFVNLLSGTYVISISPVSGYTSYMPPTKSYTVKVGIPCMTPPSNVQPDPGHLASCFP